jgi:hypothetical protein
MKKSLLIIIFSFLFWSIAFASWWAEVTVSLLERMEFFLVLVPAALWDSINPCAFAVMFILLWAILNQQRDKKHVVYAW